MFIIDLYLMYDRPVTFVNLYISFRLWGASLNCPSLTILPLHLPIILTNFVVSFVSTQVIVLILAFYRLWARLSRRSVRISINDFYGFPSLELAFAQVFSILLNREKLKSKITFARLLCFLTSLSPTGVLNFFIKKSTLLNERIDANTRPLAGKSLRGKLRLVLITFFP